MRIRAMITLKEEIMQKFPFLSKYGFAFEGGVNSVRGGKAGHVALGFERVVGKFLVSVKVLDRWYDLSRFRNLIDGTKTPNLFKSDNETAEFLEKEFPTIRRMLEAENLESTARRFEELTSESSK
jgi:hypothetical protein